MSLLQSLEWRYATKRFDASEKVSEEDIEKLKQSINLAATSFGLQHFRVKVVTDPDIKARLRAAAYNQPQVTEASHVFVFAAKDDMLPEYIDNFIKMMAEQRGVDYENLKGYGEYIKGAVGSKSAEDIKDWNRRQTYIALGTLLAEAAELRIDSCPMEGFDPAQFDEILGLKEAAVTSVVICPVGYRNAEEDPTAGAAKVRLPLNQLFL